MNTDGSGQGTTATLNHDLVFMLFDYRRAAEQFEAAFWCDDIGT